MSGHVEDWYRFRDSEIARLRSSEDVVDRLRAHADDEGTDSRLLIEAANAISRLRERVREDALRHAAAVERLAATVNAMSMAMPDDPHEADANSAAFLRGDGETCQREAC